MPHLSPSQLLEQNLHLAIAHHNAGRLQEAESLYRQILAAHPQQPDTLHLLGVLAGQVGQLDQAILLIRQAIALNPNHPETHNNLGNVLKDKGRLDEAILSFQQALTLNPNYPEAHHNLANTFKTKGQLNSAIASYRQALTLRPNYPSALNNLACAFQDNNQFDDAIAACRQALALQPNYPEALYNLANNLRQKGQTDQAIASLQQAIALNPQFAPAHNNLGNLYKENHQLDQAITHFQQALGIHPNYPDAHNNLANALYEKGDFNQALIHFQKALTLNPNYPEAHFNLANLYKEKHQLDLAIHHFQQALTLNPNYPEAHNNLGITYFQKALLDQALSSYQKALALNPDYVEAHNNLGVVLKEKHQLDQAITHFLKALTLDPQFADAHSNLGAALKDQNHFDEALASLTQALSLKPNYPEAHNNLANTLKHIGRLDEALASYRQAYTLDPQLIAAHDNYLFTLHYHPASTPQSLFTEHQLWNQKHTQPLQHLIQPHTNNPNPHRPLRIGYVSPDFREHPVGRLLLPLFTSHDPASFQIFSYSSSHISDPLTSQLQSHAHTWRNITGLSDDQTAALIRQDQIDILIDLAGHTAANRLLLFAQKPAPIQLTYLGYPNTTGLTTIDYRLVDTHTDPPELADPFNSEKLLRLPDTFLCFQPSDNTPPVSPLPALTKGHITFGSFNTLAKINDPLLNLWSQILHQVPHSHLLIKNESAHSPSTRQRLLHFFTHAGIAPDRIQFLSKTPTFTTHMESYHQVDIALDTYPYHGTATSLDALWMGLPLISLAGPSHVSRVAVSLLTNLHLPELIAHTPEQYIQLAANLATSLPRLTDLRATLRQRMLNSPLMDAPRFTKNIEQAYRTIWQTWCNPHPSSISNP